MAQGDAVRNRNVRNKEGGQPPREQPPRDWTSIRTSDGRIYDVRKAVAWECEDPEVARFCAVRLVQRDAKRVSWEFVFRFYHSFQPEPVETDWLFPPAPPEPLEIARRWITDHLEKHRQPLPPSRRGKAVVVECR
jgi:hypothetical protein